MSRPAFPSAILEQHTAVLGKTGSGKTSTAKLAIEQAVASGARVCVLDPIKSDWWGMTSSADGRRAGLPFHILGGPRGHVPLHSGAGKAIAEIVANGSLPLSIVDMAEFEPGGQARFFVDFAPMLLRKMRGVVYLVIEEAHLFAPKERSGIGAENMSIHWAKTLATAGRSKGIRLVVVTQRTQALHNALLGSCDTVIAHRLTAPADQKPVIDWLKANTSKGVLEQVSSSLASLKTGDGWICSGEAKIFERIHFPRIATYDNTATPTGDGDVVDVTTAAVDQDKLRAIIGEAVEQAKADDPKELRKQIAELKQRIENWRVADDDRPNDRARQYADRHLMPQALGRNLWAAILDDAEQLRAAGATPALTDLDRQLLRELDQHCAAVIDALTVRTKETIERLELAATQAVATAIRETGTQVSDGMTEFLRRVEASRVQKVFDKALAAVPPAPSKEPSQPYEVTRLRQPPRSASSTDAPSATMTPAMRGPLVVLANHPDGCAIGKLALLSGKKISGGFRNILAALRTAGWMEGANTDVMKITAEGLAALGHYEPLPAGAALGRYWLANSNLTPAAREILRVLLQHRQGYTINALADRVNKQVSGGFRNLLAELRTAGVIVGKNTETMRASAELFS